MNLKNLLWARGLFNLAAGIALAVILATGDVHGYERSGWYTLIDGLLGIAMAVALGSRWRTSWWLPAMAASDGVARCIVGLLILSSPGMLQVVVATLFFFDMVAFVCIVEGMIGLVAMIASRRTAPCTTPVAATVGVVAVISVCTLLLGIGMLFGYMEQEQRVLLCIYAIAVGLLWCIVAQRHRAGIVAANG